MLMVGQTVLIDEDDNNLAHTSHLRDGSRLYGALGIGSKLDT